MSAHVLLNLLNELRKRDKMRGLPSVLSIFATIFYVLNIGPSLHLHPVPIHRVQSGVGIDGHGISLGKSQSYRVP